MGGAFGRVAEDATAFPDRSAAFWLNIYGFWPDAADDAARIAWVKGFSDAMRPHAMATPVRQLPGRRRRPPRSGRRWPSTVRRSWSGSMALKRRYDPENLFRINHNIPPTA